MTPPPTSIDGTDITGATIDGQEVQEITVDGQTVFKTGPPAEGDLQARYDFSQETGGTPITDRSGNNFDLTGSFSGLSRTINGVEAGEFVSDSLTVDFAGINQPFTVAAVVKFDVLDSNKEFFDGGSSGEALFKAFNDEYQLFSNGNGYSASGVDTNPHILLARYDGTNSLIREDGTQLASGSVGDGSLTGITLGTGRNRSNFFDGLLGEVLVYRGDQAANFADIELFLGEKFGIQL